MFEEVVFSVVASVLPILAPLPVKPLPLDDEEPPPDEELGFTTSVLLPAVNVILLEDEFETAVLTTDLLSLLVFTSLRVETPLKALLATVIAPVAWLPKSAVLTPVPAKALFPIVVTLRKLATVIFLLFSNAEAATSVTWDVCPFKAEAVIFV